MIIRYDLSGLGWNIRRVKIVVNCPKSLKDKVVTGIAKILKVKIKLREKLKLNFFK